MSLFQELKRRNVFKVAAAYIIVGWLLLQVSDTLVPALHLPEWFHSGVAFILIIGFPIALILAWAFELTPEGLKKESEVDRSASITGKAGRHLNLVIIAVLAIATAYLASKLWLGEDPDRSEPSATPERSIAVLPFEYRSADEEDAEFYAAGMHDELLTMLSKISDLKVISRTSVERLDPGLSVPEIGALLNVATVLEGQVQRAGDRLRINMQLIDALKEDHLWATTYDRELSAENVFEVQSDIARTVADALHAELSSSDETLLREVPTRNTEALNLYLRGLQLHEMGSFESYEQAELNFRQATQRDPEYVQAWIAIADNASSMLDTGQISMETYLATAGPVIEKALELDDQLPEAQVQKAFFLWRSGDFTASEESLKYALSLKPGYAPTLALYGKYLRWTNRPREAIPLLEKVLRDDPLSTEILFDLAKSEMHAGNPENAIKYSEKMRQIDPDSVHGYVIAMQAYMWMGRYDLAWPYFAMNVALDPGDYETWGHIAMYWQHLGDPELSDLYMEHAIDLGPKSPAVLKCKVSVLTDREQFDEALTISSQALEAGLDDRWFSNSIFLRTLRDNAIRTRNFASARQWYLKVHPELFENPPDINGNNILAGADLVLLLQQSGELEQADELIRMAMAWYNETQPATSHGFLTSIVDVSLLALKGDREAALNNLQQAVEQGWKFDWPWHWANKNLDSIRDDPLFAELEMRMNMETAEQLAAIRALPEDKRVRLNP